MAYYVAVSKTGKIYKRITRPVKPVIPVNFTKPIPVYTHVIIPRPWARANWAQSQEEADRMYRWALTQHPDAELIPVQPRPSLLCPRWY